MKRIFKNLKPQPPKGKTPSPKDLIAPSFTTILIPKNVLSVRDFAILYNILQDKIERIEKPITYFMNDKTREEQEARHKKELQENCYYQDLLRIRDKLGSLNIEIETPSVEVENE